MKTNDKNVKYWRKNVVQSERKKKKKAGQVELAQKLDANVRVTNFRELFAAYGARVQGPLVCSHMLADSFAIFPFWSLEDIVRLMSRLVFMKNIYSIKADVITLVITWLLIKEVVQANINFYNINFTYCWLRSIKLWF